jgi:hypothetical protein
MQNRTFGKPGEIGRAPVTGVKWQYLSKLLGYNLVYRLVTPAWPSVWLLQRIQSPHIIEVDKWTP